MKQVKLKNEKNLNPRAKCGLLTYNGKNSLCNTCDPSKKPSRGFEPPVVQNSADKQKIKFSKLKGKQLQIYSKAYGKTVKYIDTSSDSLLIYFTDDTFLHIAGDNYGNGGYVYLLVSKEQNAKNDNFHLNGYECEICHHQWLPRKNNVRPKRCPKCGNIKIISLLALRRRQIEEEEAAEIGDKF